MNITQVSFFSFFFKLTLKILIFMLCMLCGCGEGFRLAGWLAYACSQKYDLLLLLLCYFLLLTTLQCPLFHRLEMSWLCGLGPACQSAVPLDTSRPPASKVRSDRLDIFLCIDVNVISKQQTETRLYIR